MANLANFKALLAAEADKSQLPMCVLKQDNDLGQLFDQVVTLDNRASGETDGQVAARYVDSICEALGSEEHKAAVELFNSTCECFAEKVKSAWSSLEGIKEQARELGKAQEEKFNSFLAADEFVQSNQKFLQLSEDFPTFNWGATLCLGSVSELAKHVNGLVIDKGLEVPETLDKSKFDIVISSLEKYTDTEEVKELTEEQLTALSDQLKTICAETPAETISEVVDMILGLSKRYDVFNALKNVANNNAQDLFKIVRKFDDFVTSAYPVLDAVVSGQVAVEDTHKELLVRNASQSLNLCYIAAYYEQMVRETVYKDSLVLQGGLRNNDLVKVFEDAGGNNKMIAVYLRKLYSDDTKLIPAMGIRVDAILQTNATYAAEVEAAIAKLNTRIELSKINARTNAFRVVAFEQIIKKVERDEPGVEGTRRSTLVNQMFNSKCAPIQDAIKQFNICPVEAALSMIIALDYEGTFVEHLQKKLGAAYLTLVSTTSEATDEAIQQTEVAVIAEFVCEFIADKLVEVVPLTERPVESPVVETKPEESEGGSDDQKTKEELVKTPGVEPATES